MQFAVRPATPGDYPAFARLFPELLVDDPVPGPGVWASELAPSAWIAHAGADVLGYCYCQEFDDTGYVRNVVVAPHARRRGVGRALMEALATRLRALGRSRWCLNVRPDNVAALALYAGVGLRERYASTALRFPWRALGGLAGGAAAVRELPPARDAAHEAAFELPRGQLAHARGRGRIVLEARSSEDERPVGLSLFNPRFPGAFPFRVTDLGVVEPLLAAMRGHAISDEYVNLVAEDDERLARFLSGAGAEVRAEFVHLQGSL